MNEAVDDARLKAVIDAVLLAAGEPVSVNQILALFGPGELEGEDVRARVRACLRELESEAAGRGYQLKRVASGYRYQVRQELSEWVSRLWDEKPPRYSRALMETLALVAYRQPLTRGDIEQVRGVSVSPNIMRTLLERGWVRVVGQREAPGRPSMYGTTRAFLDYFNLKSLDQLPPLEEIRALIEPIVVNDEAEEELRPEITVEMPADMTELAPEREDAESPEPMTAEVVPLSSLPQ
ncbi:MAG TPA: SMC-Scp complex subunit ScpB [Pseudomonadales bacterium]|jgi:segregation and condensation protein B